VPGYEIFYPEAKTRCEKTACEPVTKMFLDDPSSNPAAPKVARPMLAIQLYNNKPRCEPIWDRCYLFKNIFAEKFSEKIGVFDSKQS
jgi:hypothetical protein